MILNKICTACKISKSINNFNNKSYKCKICDAKHAKEYRKTFNGFFQNLLSACINASSKRRQKGKIEAGIINITRNDLQNLWKKQEGLCYYSKIKMALEAHSHLKACFQQFLQLV